MSLDELFIWLKVGFQHILDWNGYDHMLFLWMSFLGLGLRSMRLILWRVSLFTIAHSATLILCVYGIIPRNTQWIEACIALSITFSAWWHWKFDGTERYRKHVSSTLIFIFGLIHGMGFSGLLVSLLGSKTGLVGPLFGFNLGLEIGQILFVLVLISIQEYGLRYHRDRIDRYKQISALLGILISLGLFVDRL